MLYVCNVSILVPISMAARLPPLYIDYLVFTGMDYEYLRKQKIFSFRYISC
jgi:hypothetical protein